MSKRTVIRETDEYICDICAKVLYTDNINDRYICCMCNIDLCRVHSNLNNGLHYCPTCFEIGLPYIQKIEQAREEWVKKVGELRASWKQECLKMYKEID